MKMKMKMKMQARSLQNRTRHHEEGLNSRWAGSSAEEKGAMDFEGCLQLKALLYVLGTARDSMSLRVSGSRTRLADCTCGLLLVVVKVIIW
jgi:hypothetical protein